MSGINWDILSKQLIFLLRSILKNHLKMLLFLVQVLEKQCTLLVLRCFSIHLQQVQFLKIIIIGHFLWKLKELEILYYLQELLKYYTSFYVKLSLNFGLDKMLKILKILGLILSVHLLLIKLPVLNSLNLTRFILIHLLSFLIKCN